MNYDKIIAAVIDPIIKAEGGYSDHPSDKGGPTMFGITQLVARMNGYTGPMMEMPRSIAVAICIRRYITEQGFDKVLGKSMEIGKELIDTGVNMGPGIASIFFQRLLNAFNRKQKDYQDIFVDGRIGPASLDALTRFLNTRKIEGELVFVKALNHIQGSRYLDIAEGNQSQEDFFYGWIKNRT